MDTSNAYYEGWKAFWDSAAANPYEVGTDEGADWNEGYEDAKNEHERDSARWSNAAYG